MEDPVEAALVFVQSMHDTHVNLKGPISDANIDPPLEAELPSGRSAERHHERKDRLATMLVISKQRVVHHLLQSRGIQKSITQANIVDQAVKAHLQHVQEQAELKRLLRQSSANVDPRSGGGNNNNVHNEDAGSSSPRAILWFSDIILRHIEEAAGLEMQCATTIQQALNEYSDRSLRRELDSFPASDFPDFDATLFSRVALAASNSRVTALDAAILFQRGQEVFDSMAGADVTHKWEVLKGILRKKMQVLFLAGALQNSTSTSAETLSLLTNRQHLPAPNRTSPTKGTHQFFKSTNMALRGPLPDRFRDPKQSVALLFAKFRKSVSKQGELSNRIVSNLSEISQSIPLGSTSEHKSAIAFAKRMSVRKMANVLQKVARQAMTECWRRWNIIVKAFKAEESAISCMHYFGAYKLLQVLQKCLSSKMARAVRKVKLHVLALQEMERLAAFIECQRLFRGSLYRIRRWYFRRKIAAIHIQCIARCKRARRRVRHRRQECFFIGHVRRIEKAYMQYRLRVIGKSMQKFKRQKNKACMMQRVYRGHAGRVRVQKIRLQCKQTHGAILMQTLMRRFTATRRVAKLFFKMRQMQAAVKMESVVRGMLGRINAANVKRRYVAARTIQSCWRCHKARKVCIGRLQWLCAIKIQRVARGRIGRVRFHYFDAIRANLRHRRKGALHILTGRLLGFMIRIIWGPKVHKHVQRRRHARIMIQKTIRGFIARQRVYKLRTLQAAIARRLAKEKADEQARMKRFNVAAMPIQCIFRGWHGRRKAQACREKLERFKILEAKIPIYYRLRDDYYRAQNLHHRPFILRIQCFVRCCFAIRRMHVRRRQRAASRIQKKARARKAIRVAKKELTRRRDERRRLDRAATKMQKIVRGFMGRYEFKKNEKAEIAKWFLSEVKSLGLIGKALQNFRIRKRTLERINRQVVRMQALVRRFLVRCKFRRGHKRLVRERDGRRKAHKIRACIHIQGFARIIKAKKVFLRRKKIVDEEKKLKVSLDELEGRLDRIHDTLMTDLLATRAQTTVRGMLGKKAYSKKEVSVEKDAKKREAERRYTSATRIQAMVRGVQSRILFKKNLQSLTRERQTRSFCVECEANVAVKRCRSCKDRYCESCFSKIHRKGARRTHLWDPVAVQNAGKAVSKAGDKMQSKQPQQENLNIKKNWEKFFDNAAKASYWFNSKTGEASWVNPFPPST